jgi:hypothetical protein
LEYYNVAENQPDIVEMLAKPESTLLYPRTVDIEAMLRTEMVTEETKIMQGGISLVSFNSDYKMIPIKLLSLAQIETTRLKSLAFNIAHLHLETS